MGLFWMMICRAEEIRPNTAVSVQVLGRHVAIFRIMSEYYAVSDFDLKTGKCLDDPAVRVRTYPLRVVNGVVQISLQGD